MKNWRASLGLRAQQKPVRTRHLGEGPQISLALSVLFRHLRVGRKYNILDLGPACGSNVDFFSQFASKIYIEDFYQTLTSFGYLSPEDGISYEEAFEYFFPYWENTRFDYIIGWDIVNYLKRDEFYHLISYLGRFCHPGTCFFSLVSTLKHIPERPTTFKIIDQERLFYTVNSSVVSSCPQYAQGDLNQLMPGFRVTNSFLLRNGFKEYLLVCDRPTAR